MSTVVPPKDLPIHPTSPTATFETSPTSVSLNSKAFLQIASKAWSEIVALVREHNPKIFEELRHEWQSTKEVKEQMEKQVCEHFHCSHNVDDNNGQLLTFLRTQLGSTFGELWKATHGTKRRLQHRKLILTLNSSAKRHKNREKCRAELVHGNQLETENDGVDDAAKL
ncbi:hypothetical protein BGZ65_009256, partial [Modicella reniformis]